MLEHVLGPGTLKVVVKGVNLMTGGALHGTEKVLEEITSSPAYTKYRVDHARETLSDFWDDHKDGVHDFIDNAGDTISSGLESAGEAVGGVLESIGETFGEILGGLF